VRAEGCGHGLRSRLAISRSLRSGRMQKPSQRGIYVDADVRRNSDQPHKHCWAATTVDAHVLCANWVESEIYSQTIDMVVKDR